MKILLVKVASRLKSSVCKAYVKSSVSGLYTLEYVSSCELLLNIIDVLCQLILLLLLG